MRSGKQRRIQDKLDRIAMEKMAIKEAFREWANEKWDETCKRFGAWSIRTISLLLFLAAIWFILQMNGWHLKQ